MTKLSCILAITFSLSTLAFACNYSEPLSEGKAEVPTILEVPRIEYVEPNEVQAHQHDSNVIWYDDFNHGARKYLEGRGEIDTTESFGGKGGAMMAGFKKGDVSGEGDRKLSFGDFPGTRGSVVRGGETFDEIYWRVYVKLEHGWQGSPAKMSRATSIVSTKWQQAMIVHVWSGKENTLTLDPASGVSGQGSTIVTTKYNDFDNLNWLGNSPSSEFKIYDTENSGCWILVEALAKLNTPGKNDGLARLWIDGRLEAERENMNFRGSYTAHGINAVFLESYWNNGSVKTQGRWYDNFIVSTKRIGPVVCPSNPVLQKTPYHGPASMAAWEVQLATDSEGKEVVFKSSELGKIESMLIDSEHGNFTGKLEGQTGLSSEFTYFCKVRQKSANGLWSDWSHWHQNFNVGL